MSRPIYRTALLNTFSHLLGLVVGFLGYQATQQGETKSETPAALKNLDRQKGDQLAQSIEYIYEKRTGQAFAYRQFDGGMAFSVVPYGKVKHVLLNPPSEDPPGKYGY